MSTPDPKALREAADYHASEADHFRKQVCDCGLSDCPRRQSVMDSFAARHALAAEALREKAQRTEADPDAEMQAKLLTEGAARALSDGDDDALGYAALAGAAALRRVAGLDAELAAAVKVALDQERARVRAAVDAAPVIECETPEGGHWVEHVQLADVLAAIGGARG